MPNAFISKRNSIIPFDRVVAIRASLNDSELFIYLSSTDKIDVEFKSPDDLEAQRNAFLAYLTHSISPI